MMLCVPRELEPYRIRSGVLETDPGDPRGAFLYPFKQGARNRTLKLIVSEGDERVRWEHVSVSIAAVKPSEKIIPTWRMMAHVKDLFWDPEDVVIQIHPARSSYVNMHPGTLHLWRPLDVEIPLPPMLAV